MLGEDGARETGAQDAGGQGAAREGAGEGDSARLARPISRRWFLGLVGAGTIGLFLTLFYLFIRVLPMISIFEMRELVHKKSPGKHVEMME